MSILINAEAVRECGLPMADYFLWNDDFEYTARLLRHHEGFYVPASRVRHLTRAFGDSGRIRGRASTRRCATRSGCSPAPAP